MSWFLLMTQPAGGGAQSNPIAAFLPIIFIVVIFYFLLIRPQQKRAKQHRTMMEGLKSGDSVVTVGGLHGTVAAVDQDTVIVRVADNVKLTFNKSAIAGLVSQKE
jgi:preprotein translocase subunit YajC